MSFDLLLRNASLPDGRTGIDIACEGGKILGVEPNIEGEAGQVIEADGRLVAPPFVDPHFHMDATLSLGHPRLNESGTLLEGIALWGELKPLLTHEVVAERALSYCDLAVSQGLLAIRSHVDICDDRLLAVEALLDVKNRVKDYLDLSTRRLPAGRLLPLPQRRRQSRARARHGRRGGGRHSAFRAHHGGRRSFPEGAVRDRGGARPDGRYPLRRERRSDVAAHRDAGL